MLLCGLLSLQSKLAEQTELQSRIKEMRGSKASLAKQAAEAKATVAQLEAKLQEKEAKVQPGGRTNQCV